MNSSVLPVPLFALILVLGCGLAGSSGEAVSEEEEAQPDTILAKGSFDGKEGIETSGAYRIERADGDLKLVLAEDFQTESGPDLFVVLSPHSPEETTGENVLDGAAVTVDSLRSLGGRQTYDLRDDLNLEPFDSVAIQCIQYAHLYGAAALD